VAVGTGGKGRPISDADVERARVAIDTYMLSRHQPEFSKEDITKIEAHCTDILNDRDRLTDIKAIVLSLFVELDSPRVPATMFEHLFEFPTWPTSICGKISSQTVNNFATTDMRPPNWRILSTYLYSIAILELMNHPRLKHIVVQALLRTSFDYRYFKSVAGLARAGGDDRVLIDKIISKGGHLYDLFEETSQISITDIEHSPFFSEASEANHDRVLDEFGYTAVRLGYSGDKFVASRLGIFKVRSKTGRKYLYLRTWSANEDGEGVLRTEGFVIPRRREVYFFQYHLNGAGLNIMSIPIDQIAIEEQTFYRGIVLAIDRNTGANGLASHVVVHKNSKIPAVFGEIPIDHHLKYYKNLEMGAVGERIGNYVRNYGQVIIKSLLPDHAELPIDIYTWDQISEFLGDAGNRFNAKTVSERWVQGRLRAPLKNE
jgi:hypothetical protein